MKSGAQHDIIFAWPERLSQLRAGLPIPDVLQGNQVGIQLFERGSLLE